MLLSDYSRIFASEIKLVETRNTLTPSLICCSLIPNQDISFLKDYKNRHHVFYKPYDTAHG